MDGIGLEGLAKQYGTPLYVYSEKSFFQQIHSYRNANPTNLPIQIHFAIKSNSNQSILKRIAKTGAGADIVSGGELFRALRAGFAPEKIVFSGVGKTETEIREALGAGIGMISIESEAELARIADVADQMNLEAPFSIRVNPEVDPMTHPYISTGLKENKFGIEQERVIDLYHQAQKMGSMKAKGIGFHIGSQLTRIEPHLEAIDRVLEIREALERSGISLPLFDVGGGLGIEYGPYDNPPAIQDFVSRIMTRIQERKANVTVLFEPGRSIVGNSGILLTRILYQKFNGEKRFQVCDAAMNDLIRPSLYGAVHRIFPVEQDRPLLHSASDLVGPICETGDFLLKDSILPDFQTGDLAAIYSAGAYGMVMSSNYNSRPRAAEVLIQSDGSVALIRKRETYEDLIRQEEDL